MSNHLSDHIRIDVYQDDGIEAFGSYRPGLSDGKAMIGISVERLLGLVATDTIPAAELPYVVAETIMHEMLHALEEWAGVAFSEERVEELIQRYGYASKARNE